jgi:hypothetical protein
VVWRIFIATGGRSYKKWVELAADHGMGIATHGSTSFLP